MNWGKSALFLWVPFGLRNQLNNIDNILGGLGEFIHAFQLLSTECQGWSKELEGLVSETIARSERQAMWTLMLFHSKRWDVKQTAPKEVKQQQKGSLLTSPDEKTWSWWKMKFGIPGREHYELPCSRRVWIERSQCFQSCRFKAGFFFFRERYQTVSSIKINESQISCTQDMLSIPSWHLLCKEFHYWKSLA